ncbi:g10065 [Coccomyxa elongata]
MASQPRDVRLVLALLCTLVSSYAFAEGAADSRFFKGRWFPRSGPVSQTELHALRDEGKEMFSFGFDNYMRHGFPKDEVRPISCRGRDSQGGIAITLIDSLDTILLMNGGKQLVEAVNWLEQNLTFDLDERVHVFELTIRALGGLSSMHVLLTRNPAIMPEYDGGLLRLATDLGDRLLPAFDTPTGIPLSWVNLRKGVSAGETRITCTACAGTLLLEFGLLSRLTGNPTYEQKALHAARQVFGIRSTVTGLVGNTLNVDTLSWVRFDASIGAGVDSFYEYLLKAYLQFGEEEYLTMFAEMYAAAMRHLRPEDPGWAARGWLAEVDMHTGAVTRPWISSLSAFWPGLQALIGQLDDAALLHGNWTAAWKAFGWLPELFDAGLTQRHPLQRGYPLRPELIESTYLLHAATGDGSYLEAGRLFQATLVERNKQKCGYASVADVATGALEDTMESFFLSETTKYLCLLHSNATALPDYYIFSTEGHLLPVLPSAADAEAPEQVGASASADGLCKATKETEGGRREVDGAKEQGGTTALGLATGQKEGGHEERSARLAPEEEGTPPANCAALCATQSAAEVEEGEAALREAFPVLPLAAADAALLRRRRCTACRVVTRAMAEMRLRAAVEAAAACSGENCTTPASPQELPRQILCRLQVDKAGKLTCYHLEVVVDMPPAKVQSLPPDAVIVQFTQIQAPNQAMAAAPDYAAQGGDLTPGEPPETFLELLVSGQGPDGKDFELILVGAGASFGPELDQDCNESQQDQGSRCSASGDFVVGVPSDGCQPLTSTVGAKGSILVLERGSCMFAQKVAHAQAVGAVAAVVLSDEEWLMQMGDDDVNNPTIPSILLPAREADTLRRALADAPGRPRGALQALTPEQAAAAMSAPGQPGTCLAPASGGVPAGDSGQVLGSTGGSREGSDGSGDQEQCRWQLEVAAHGSVDGSGGDEEGGIESGDRGNMACGMGEEVVDGGVERGVSREGVNVGGGGVEQPREGTQMEDQQALLSLQEGLQNQLGPEQAASAAQAAFASATAVLQQKRVEVLIPPQAATWLQEEQQSGKALDVGAAVNSMLMQIARDKLAANIRDLAAAAMQLAAAQGAAREAAAAGPAAA